MNNNNELQNLENPVPEGEKLDTKHRGKSRRKPGYDKEKKKIHQELYTPVNLRKQKKRGKEWLVVLIPAIAAVAAVIVVLFTYNRGSGYILNETGKQYYGGSITTIPAGTKMTVTEDGPTILQAGDNQEETTLPIYLGSSRSVMLTKDWLYFTVRSNTTSRIPVFGQVECSQNGVVTMSRDNKSVQTEHGFLYDGGDFYLFLEPMVLEFNGYKVNVPSLSYAEAVYGGYMMIFNYETKEFMIELSDGTGTATSVSGDYTISLLGDSVVRPDGKKALLSTRPELYDPVV